MPFLRKYNTASVISGIPLITKSAVDFKSSPTLATGDVQISKDDGDFANLATLPTVTPTSGTSVKLALSATELSCARAVIRFVDQTSPKEWEDQQVVVETYGNASATIPDGDLNSGIDTLLSRLTETRAGLLDYIDAAISTRLATSGYTAPANSNITDIKAKTDQLTFTQANKVDATATVDTSSLATASALATVDGNVDSIKAKTDQLTFTTPNQVDSSATMEMPENWTLPESAVTDIRDGLALQENLDALDAVCDSILAAVNSGSVNVALADGSIKLRTLAKSLRDALEI